MVRENTPIDTANNGVSNSLEGVQSIMSIRNCFILWPMVVCNTNMFICSMFNLHLTLSGAIIVILLFSYLCLFVYLYFYFHFYFYFYFLYFHTFPFHVYIYANDVCMYDDDLYLIKSLNILFCSAVLFIRLLTWPFVRQSERFNISEWSEFLCFVHF